MAGTILIPSEWRKWNSYIPRCDVVRNLSDDDEETAFYSGYLFGLANDGGKGQRMLSVGDKMKFYCNMDDIPFSELNDSVIKKLTTSIDVVNHIEPLDPAREEGRKGWRIVWITATTMGGLLRAERVSEIVETSDGGCEYVAYESFGGFAGLMPWMVKKTMARKLVRGFGHWAIDLKERAEGLVVDPMDGMVAITKDKHGNWAFINRDGSLRYSGRKDTSVA